METKSIDTWNELNDVVSEALKRVSVNALKDGVLMHVESFKVEMIKKGFPKEIVEMIRFVDTDY